MSFIHFERGGGTVRGVSQECIGQLREVCLGFKMATGYSQSRCYSQWGTGSERGGASGLFSLSGIRIHRKLEVLGERNLHKAELWEKFVWARLHT